MRGKLVSRPAHAVLREAEKLVEAGVKELLVISQDTSAYGTDAMRDRGHEGRPSPIWPAIWGAGRLGAAALRLSLPPCARADPADGRGAGPALSRHPVPARPSRHAAPHGAAGGGGATLDEIAAWRAICPDITLRSTFIVGYPGETEAEFQTLLDWLDEAQLDRVGCFQYENVAGRAGQRSARSCARRGQGRPLGRFMEKAQAISEAKLAAKVGQRMQVIVDEVDADGATCRTKADAPEIDGNLFIDEASRT
jgi:ribosomal protein S12 methylthiotransferase